MAAATGCSSSLYPFSVLVASSSSQGWALPPLAESTSRSFKFRDDWALQRSKPFGSGGSYFYGSTPWGKCRTKHLSGIQYPLSIAGVLLVCLVVFLAIAFTKGGPSAIVAGLAKSGFTAAFMLIFVSEIGDKVIHFIQMLLGLVYIHLIIISSF
ncbi:GDT1-like protein 2, chloroplastic [Dendrobium catenatum]|uniref:GDT1-like protein 2, chloroplastic n=1 Tax=Dendrobium catenatum TaxID=906689 RepID=A0A2I0W1I5_9ASPA|nr:GDT1-like protein 2, chloroplastic [Dendrobium catenatum]